MFHRKWESIDFLEYRAEGNGANQPLPYFYIHISHIQKIFPQDLLDSNACIIFTSFFDAEKAETGMKNTDLPPVSFSTFPSY